MNQQPFHAELLHMSATEVAQGIRVKTFSAVEVMEATLAACNAGQALTHCFLRIDEESALSAARMVDAEIAQGIVRGPFAGVPMAHKDMFYRQGIASSCGSVIAKDRVAASTATVLNRLDAAGAIQFGVLNMTEFAYGPLGHNYHYGHNCNPWHPDSITGGSSAGSGSSLAARVNFLALGSDTGGSIRSPAHFNGVCGLKTTTGRVSRAGAMPLSFSLDTVGPMARTCADLALALQVLAGADPLDATSSVQMVPDYVSALNVPVKGLRVGIPTGFFYDDLAPEIEAPLRESLRVLESLGCTLIEVPMPDIETWNQAATAIIAVEAAAMHSAWLRERPQDYSDQLRARLEVGLAVPAVQYVNALRLRGQALQTWLKQVVSNIDVLHAPVVNFATPTIAETDVGGGPRLAQVMANATRLLRPVNYLGLPSLAVPCGFQQLPHAMPVAFQLIGRPFAESTLLRLGHAYQQATDWHKRAPPSVQ